MVVTELDDIKAHKECNIPVYLKIPNTFQDTKLIKTNRISLEQKIPEVPNRICFGNAER